MMKLEVHSLVICAVYFSCMVFCQDIVVKYVPVIQEVHLILDSTDIGDPNHMTAGTTTNTGLGVIKPVTGKTNTGIDDRNHVIGIKDSKQLTVKADSGVRDYYYVTDGGSNTGRGDSKKFETDGSNNAVGRGDSKYVVTDETNLTNVGRQERWYGGCSLLGGSACKLACLAQFQDGGYCDGDQTCVCTDQFGDVECPVLALLDCTGLFYIVYTCAGLLVPEQMILSALSPMIPMISLAITATRCVYYIFNVRVYSEACRACSHSFCESLFHGSSMSWWCDGLFHSDNL